jgi:hypothetical protein
LFNSIIIRHELGLDRPVSALSNSLLKGLPSRLRLNEDDNDNNDDNDDYDDGDDDDDDNNNNNTDL